MLGQIAEAQAALESDIELLRHAAAISGDSSALAVAQGQMSRLAGLQHRIEHAHGGGLAAIRAEVMASVAASQTLAQQARSTVASTQAAEVALHAASAAAHREVASFVHDFYERKIFDPYLRFASPEDEAAYRQREEAYQRAITEASAEGTPDGNLRASRLALAQLEDAGAHGADASPEYERQHRRLSGQERNLSQALDQPDIGPSQQSDAGLAPSEQALVPSDLVAALRNAGASGADVGQKGHGVSSINRPADAAVGRV